MSTIVRRNVIYVWLIAISLLLGILDWKQAAAERKVTEFVEIDVQRINVREPDGTLRMTISNSATAPGLVIKGTEHPFANRQAAGILFFNDEGTENGGLLFGGAKRGRNVSSGGHLSFDRPDTPLSLDLIDKLNTPEGSAEFETLTKAGGFGYPRVFIGKNEERASAVILRDAKGLARLRLTVTPGGAASIEFLNESGKVTRRIAEN
jgi:hypothetical protein